MDYGLRIIVAEILNSYSTRILEITVLGSVLKEGDTTYFYLRQMSPLVAAVG